MTCMQCGTKKNTRFIDECGFALCKADAKDTDYDFDKPKPSFKLDNKSVEKVEIILYINLQEFNKFKDSTCNVITLEKIQSLADALGINLEADV